MSYRKTRLRLLPNLLIAMLVALMAVLKGSAVASEISDKVLEQAIQDRICFEVFWWNRDGFLLGKKAPMFVRNSSGITYVWSDGLFVTPNVQKWANFFSVFSNGSEGIVGTSVGYNVDAVSDTREFQTNRALVFDGPHKEIDISLPRDCTPRVKIDSPQKIRMMRVVEESVAHELTLFSKAGDAARREHVRITIANFNPDDPETLVLVDGDKQLFRVALHSASDPISDSFLKLGEYPIQPVYNSDENKSLIDKINAYGVRRDIDFKRP